MSRPSKPLKGHEFHTRTNASLEYIIKDASAAAKCMRGLDTKAEAKYLDQVNDASTILHWRNKWKNDEHRKAN